MFSLDQSDPRIQQDRATVSFIRLGTHLNKHLPIVMLVAVRHVLPLLWDVFLSEDLKPCTCATFPGLV